jgi:hypothetical protein
LLSDELSRRYGWNAAEAATFVLTDGVPRVASIKGRWTIRMFGDSPTPPARVVLTVDPATTPNDLRDWYRRERDKRFGGKRYRTISTKHLRLATHDLLQPDDASPTNRMFAWNERTKDLVGYRYGHISNYLRDAKAARERLTSLPIDWRLALTGEE